MDNNKQDFKNKVDKRYIKFLKEHIDQIPNEANWLAMDSDGSVWVYGTKPTVYPHTCWMDCAKNCSPTKVFSLNPKAFDMNWKDSLISTQMLKSVDHKETPTKTKSHKVTSILTFKLWKPGETVLVGRVIEAINIPIKDNCLTRGVFNEFQSNCKGLILGERGGEMMIKFKDSEERAKLSAQLIQNLIDCFRSAARRQKITSDDIGKKVECYAIYGGATLRAITTEGEFVIEDKLCDGSSRLCLVEDAWIETEEDRFQCTQIECEDGSTLYEFIINN